MGKVKASEIARELKPYFADMLKGLQNQPKAGKNLADPYAIILYDATHQAVKLYSHSETGLSAALAAMPSGGSVWMPAGTIPGEHVVPAGGSLVGVNRDKCILTGQITLGAGSVLQNVTVSRTGSSSATAVIAAGNNAWAIGCKLSVVLTGGTPYAASPHGDLYLRDCDILCTLNGVDSAPFEVASSLVYNFASDLQGWAYVAEQIAHSTGTQGETALDASCVSWNTQRLMFTFPPTATFWKYGAVSIDISSLSILASADVVFHYEISLTGWYRGAMIEFTDGSHQHYYESGTGDYTIDAAHYGKTIKAIHIGIHTYNSSGSNYSFFVDNVSLSGIGGDVHVYGCRGIDGEGISLVGDRAAYDAADYPALHANDTDTATGIHHTIGTGANQAASGATLASHTANTSNPHSVTKTQVGLGNVADLKCNLAATAAPGTGDDSADGYAVGSSWFDTTNDRVYLCVDATEGAAVWKEVEGGGASVFTELTDAFDSYTGLGGQYVKVKSTEDGLETDSPAGSGDVSGPASAVDGHLAVFDGATGKLVKDGGEVPAGGGGATDILQVQVFS